MRDGNTIPPLNAGTDALHGLAHQKLHQTIGAHDSQMPVGIFEQAQLSIKALADERKLTGHQAWLVLIASICPMSRLLFGSLLRCR